MKKLFKILIITALAMTSCNHQEPKSGITDSKQQIEPKQEFAKLNEFLQKFDEPSQTFKVPTDKPIKVKGKQGTIIHIDSTNLETENGQSIGKELQIEFKELSTQGQLLRAHAQTVSDGQLLISGGAYYINVTSDGQKVKVKEGKAYSVEFPKLSNDTMTLYYGQRDSSNKMNWKQADQKFESPKPKTKSPQKYEAVLILDRRGKFNDTSRIQMENYSQEEIAKIQKDAEKESEISSKVYRPISLSQFGWINCDRIFPKSPRTNVQYEITNRVEDVNYAYVYLIFKEIKSVWQSSYYIYNNKIEKDNYNNIPTGATVKFFAVSYQHQKIFATLTKEMQVSENLNEKLKLQEVSESDFDKLIRNLE